MACRPRRHSRGAHVHPARLEYRKEKERSAAYWKRNFQDDSHVRPTNRGANLAEEASTGRGRRAKARREGDLSIRDLSSWNGFAEQASDLAPIQKPPFDQIRGQMRD